MHQPKLPDRDAENKMHRTEQRILGRGTNVRSVTHTGGSPRDTSETIMTENVPESISGTKPQVQEAQKTS